jgi:hypothetical protein
MSDQALDQSLLNLIIAPQVEDAVIDWLLQCECISGFTSMPISGHGSSIHSLSTAEQVAGRRRQILIQSYLPRRDGEELVKALQRDFAGSGMHYWLTPLEAVGHLD